VCSYASQFVIVFYQFLAVFLVDFRFEDIRIFMFTAFQNPILSNRLVNFLFCIFPFQDFNKDSNTISISNLHLTFNCIWLRVSNQICLWGFLFIIILANIYVHSDFVRNKPAKVNFLSLSGSCEPTFWLPLNINYFKSIFQFLIICLFSFARTINHFTWFVRLKTSSHFSNFLKSELFESNAEN